MTKGQEEAFIRIHGMILANTKSEVRRRELLEEYLRSAGLSIPNWLERVKETLAGLENGAAALESVERFCADNWVEDEAGPVYYRRFLGYEWHYHTVTFDRSRPEGRQLLSEEYPDWEGMDLKQLYRYRRELEEAQEELDGDSPTADSPRIAHRLWQDKRDDLDRCMAKTDEYIRLREPAPLPE